MKKQILLLVSGFLVSFNVSALELNPEMKAKVVGGLSGESTEALNFGTIAVTGTPTGKTGIVISPINGNRTNEDSEHITLVPSQTSAGAVSINGTSNTVVYITTPQTAQTVSATNDKSKTMTVTEFTTDGTANSSASVNAPYYITLDGSGTGTVKIGATLIPNTSQLEGEYTGTYPLILSYN